VTSYTVTAALPSNQQQQQTSTVDVFASLVNLLAESPEATNGTSW
jgi:hypothetical protein